MPYYHKQCYQNLGRKSKKNMSACDIMSYSKCLKKDGKYKHTKRCRTLGRKIATILR